MDYLSYRTINTKIKADTFTIQTITPTITSNQILKDYQAFANIRDPSFMSSVQSTVISSRLDNKSIEIKTLAQINPFADGLMTISGANQAIIRIKTIGTTSAVIELDENGDGTYEATQTLTWDSFINP